MLLTLFSLLLSSRLAPALVNPPQAFAATPEVACYPQGGTGKITGTVTAAGGGPLQYVDVRAYTALGKSAGNASTNAAGVYQISNLIAGSYILQFKPASGNVMPEWSGNQPTALTATAVAVSVGGTTSGVDAALDPGGQFAGLVRGADGSGNIENAIVTVYDSSGNPVASAYTDNAGNFITRPGLRTGNYRIGFSQVGAFLDRFYNDKASLDTADILSITGSGTVFNINPLLPKGGSISGKISNAATGLPISGYFVAASNNDDGGYTYSDINGNYTITGLQSGSYTIQAHDSFVTGNLISVPQQASVTAPENTANINFQFTPGGTITGRVTSGGMALDASTIYISNQDGSYQNYVYTNATGVYTATGLPSGQYTVFFRPSNHISEYYNDRPEGSDVRDQISVTAPNTVTGIDADLALGGSISGKVVDATTNVPLKGIFVEILDANGERVESTSTAADGSYTTATTLPNGSYRVRFNADDRNTSCAYVSEYYNDSLSKAGATPVLVTAPTAVSNINAALSQGSIIFGKLTDEATGAPITSGGVRVFYADGTFAMFGRLSIVGGYQTETALPSGNYLVQFYDNDGGYINEYYNDKLSKQAADPITLSAPTPLYNINAALRKGALISGHVTTADKGTAFSDGYVIVYDLSGQEITDTGINEDGSYLVNDGLAPGDYLIAALPYDHQGLELSSLPAQALPSPKPSGYVLSFHGNSITPTNATKVTVSTATTISGIDISMLHGVWLPVVTVSK